VVAARAGGLREIVDEGHTGLLFDPAVATDLPAHLTTLVQREEVRIEMGRRARQRALGWSWADATHALRRAYQQVLPAV
jgi:phosphatidylinositol alpha 1,6-mannosyltransferase